ncbi:MAG: hypothetical protein ACI9XO_004217 [Paraglaciecola sp.]|jgi:hypothetical protein
MTQLFFLLKMLKKASITGYLRLFLAFLKGERASQIGKLFFTNSLTLIILTLNPNPLEQRSQEKITKASHQKRDACLIYLDLLIKT